MNKQNFQFDGNWEYEIELPLLSGFKERNGAYTAVSSDKSNSGLFNLQFEDDLSENPDPYAEQLETLNYIFDNQEKIADLIISRTLSELKFILPDYGLEDEEAYQDLDGEKVKSLIGISSIVIKTVAKDGFSYFDISGGCNWDEEHGLNILFHKDRIISFGGIDGDSTYKAKKDNGTVNKEPNLTQQREKPQRYLPHPKYNKLKPSQRSANEIYEYALISFGYNDDFIKGIESGEIELNGKWISQDKTWLEAACWFKNNDLVKFLLSKKAEIRYALHECVGYGNNKEGLEILLQNGADINSQYRNGNTVLYEIVNTLESHYRATNYYLSINRPDLITKENQDIFESKKELARDLIKRGADPNIKNVYGFSCFDVMRNSDERSRNDVHRFLTECISQK